MVLLDIKHTDDEEHKKLTGVTNKNILAFAEFLSENGVKTWIRHVLVTGITDFDEQLIKLRKFTDKLKTVEKVEVLPYHTMGEIKYKKMGIEYPLRGVNPPAPERIENAKKILCE